LGTLHWSLLDADQRSSAQAKAQETLLSVPRPDWSICYAAVVGLQALSTMPERANQAQFEQMARTDPDTAVRAS